MPAIVMRRPVAAFFAAAFLITWSVWVPRALVDRAVVDWAWPTMLSPLSSYGPALAALLVVWLTGRPSLTRDFWARLRH
jgi:hypothetical protein